MRQRCANCGWLSVNPSGAMFCGYSDERTWEDESCMAWKDNEEPQTNADTLRAMTDEELAEFMNCGACPPGKYVSELCYDEDGGSVPDMCNLCWLDWLKEEAKE